MLVGANFDPFKDPQAGSAGLDLIGDADNPLFYTAFDDKGTDTVTDDEIGFRVRIGNVATDKDFSSVFLVGIDADADGDLDLFLSADGRGPSPAVTIWAPGSGTNDSPNTTSIVDPSDQIVTTFSSANFALTAVSATSDPNVTDTDIGDDGKVDNFVSFKLAFSDFQGELSRITGFAGSTSGGVSINIDKDTPLRYVVMTLTQENAINGDIGGLNGGNSSTSTFESLGIFSETLTASNVAPTITSNGGVDAAAISIAENTTAVTTVAGTDADGDTVSFSITGGADSAKFEIDATTGVLTFKAAPDFETPTDTGVNNTYVVIIQASDGNGGADTQTIIVTVSDVNEAPVIASNGGGDTAAVTVAENSTAVTTAAASDPESDTPTFSISGGADSAQFAIDETTGALTFVTAPDFKAPTDSDGNNIYVVTVQTTDANGLTDTQTISVTVTAVNEVVLVVPADPPPVDTTPTDSGGGDTTLTGGGGTVLIASQPFQDVGQSQTISEIISKPLGGITPAAEDSTQPEINFVTGLEPAVGPVGGAIELSVDAGIPDQSLDTNTTGNFRLEIPNDAFKTSGGDASESAETEYVLDSTQADGTPLPTWLTFDTETKTFSGEPPGGETITVNLNVIARDAAGNEATASFRITFFSSESTATGVGSASSPEVTAPPSAPESDAGADDAGPTDSGPGDSEAGDQDSGAARANLLPAATNENLFQVFLDAGISDQVFDTTLIDSIIFEIPDNAFKVTGIGGNSDSNVELSFSATRADGAPLPEWLTFDAYAQTFNGEPPDGETFTLDLRIIVTDEFGNQAEATFRMIFNAEEDQADASETEQQEQAGIAEAEADEQDDSEVAAGDLGESGAEDQSAEAAPASIEQAALAVSDRVIGKPSLSEQFDQFGHGKFRNEALRIALGNELIQGNNQFG